MAESLADIEELALRCKTDQARDYITEAIQCYRAGAYRACIVGTWIAVVFDLVDKIRELALSGDKVAGKLEEQYVNFTKQMEDGNDQGVKSALEFERNILATCKDELQFFDRQQYSDLGRLRDDRHLCAHPSFQKVGEPFKPPAELARLHLRNAIVHVLSQLPVQGKSALAELRATVGSNYFPKKTTEATILLKSSPLANAKEPLVRGFIDALVFGFFETGGPLSMKPQVASAINASYEMHPGIVEERLRKVFNKVARDANDDKYRLVPILVALVPPLWAILDEANRLKTKEYIRAAPGPEVTKLLRGLSAHSDLAQVVAERIANLTDAELADAIPRLGEIAKEQVIKRLEACRSWISTNSVITELLIPIYESLTKADIERIIRMPVESGTDLIGAAGYDVFLNRVRLAGVYDSAELNKLLTENGAVAYVTIAQPSSDDEL